jgi:hypothetical protein
MEHRVKERNVRQAISLRHGMYALLHNYNVTSMSQPVLYGKKEEVKCYMAIDFASYQEAEAVKATFYGHLFQGARLRVFNWQPARKCLEGGSWDSGRGGAHFSGKRDQGSATGTNFEHMQEEILREAILGANDRKSWVR